MSSDEDKRNKNEEQAKKGKKGLGKNVSYVS